MTKEQIDALYEECYKKSLVGATMQYMSDGGVTTHGMDRALAKDSGIWRDLFFKQYFTGENAERFKTDKNLREFCHNLFRNAFVFGGSFMCFVIDNFKPEPTFETTIES